MSASNKHIAYLFPGQGAQYVGMGKDFADNFSCAKETIEEAEDILGRKLQKLIFEGPESDLTETHNGQVAIYVNSMAVLRTIEHLYPHLQPHVCAGLSLGEYTALTATGQIDVKECLPLVQRRGLFMSDACKARKGEMAVILGLQGEVVEQMVKELNLPFDLWAANFNCPGQVVISGTAKGVRAGSERAKALGAKRILPLQVHGAFHSGMMQEAEEKLRPYIVEMSLKQTKSQFVMNVTGTFVKDPSQLKENLIRQVTSPVRWEQGIRTIEESGLFAYFEIGGKSLTGMNNRIGVAGASVSIDKVEDLKRIEEVLGK